MFWNWNLRNVDDPTSASPTCVSLLLGGTSQAKLPLASIGRAGWAPGTWNPSTGCLAQARRSGVAGVVESLINFHFLDRISERMARNCATVFELATQITTNLLCGKAAPKNEQQAQQSRVTHPASGGCWRVYHIIFCDIPGKPDLTPSLKVK